MKRFAVGLVVAVALAVSACDSSGPGVLTGRLVGGTGPLPGAIQGMHYRAGDHSGFTDATGSFNYAFGDSVVFSVGALEFEPVAAGVLVSPFQLARGSGCAVDEALNGVLQVVQSLDVDDDPDNGIRLPEPSPAGTPTKVASLGVNDLEAAIRGVRADATLVAADVALDRFIRQIDDEAWSEGPADTFEVLLDSLYRSQGVATDGRSWFFSARNHLQRTTFAFEVQAENESPIPQALRALGGNHIGDIDVYDGLLYAPVEDGPEHLHPTIVTYSADTLEPTGDVYPISTDLLTKGVPWVAVDGPRRRVYTAEWDPTLHINVLDLDADLAFVKTIELSSPIGRIQGAKVFGGQMYASSDDDQKTIYKIDLDTGAVLTLFTLGTTGSEVEGLALLSSPGGARMRIENVVIPNVQLLQYRRTRDPLRDAICP
jgi:hypothetical protein